ncbi:polysaccharide biosynthesis protein [Tamlana crocina]|uniref:Polysaccharide biosynthesis protein n=1 Tax=Tamlana crocina TaxID=393006 RepID=A0ABX1D9V3_9FLAO|nr:polysaccharide biosynthesis protein [Tamlana crocina]NJX15144.1 polysaccharide biosynthesis protein [Tamlana crocina]
MSEKIALQIDQLLVDSGLFETEVKPTAYDNDFDFSNETILITGAAGTVGSELSKQLFGCRYKNLVLVDMAESPLYDLIKTFELNHKNHTYYHLLNINDSAPLHFVFEKYKPTMVFHAAAYKHVPLTEEHPFAGIKTNIFATKQLAELSIQFGVKKFIFISTDKAVNPSGIMGMTKRIAEKHLSYLNVQYDTVFLNARFGNILGSNGSVVPLFKKQIKNGMPITLTEKDISRYFICKRKACYLILKMARFNKNTTNTFTFNMGEPIKIIDIIQRMLKYYNKNGSDIEIKYTGLRPGEKLFEEMISENEYLEPTLVEDIWAVKEKNKQKFEAIDFKSLEQINFYTPYSEIKSILKKYL